MKLSIVIPVFNERKTIEELIRRVQKAGKKAQLSCLHLICYEFNTEFCHSPR